MNAPFTARGRGSRQGEVTEFDPDVLSDADVLRARRWCRRRPELACELVGLPLRLSFSATSSGISSQPGCHLQFTISGDPCAISLPVAVIDELLKAIEGPSRATLSERDLLLLLEFSCAAILDGVEKALGLTFALTHISVGCGAPDRAGLLCRGTLGETSFSALLSLPERYDAHLAQHVSASDLAPAAGIPICVVFRVGVTCISARLLASLRPGDVVIIEHVLPDESIIAVFGERRLASCRIQGSSVTVADVPLQIRGDLHQYWTAVDMTTREGADSGTGEVSLDDIQIKLLFEVGQLEISLGELRTMAPGYVFDLGRDPRHVVEIHAGSRRIGQGEIVKLGDALGVRISKLFNYE